MKKKITIIDYDMGNIFNIFKSFEKLDCEAELTNEPRKILNADRLVLPGVGSFENGINNLKKYKPPKNQHFGKHWNKRILV